jgi:hypothetical protein
MNAGRNARHTFRLETAVKDIGLAQRGGRRIVTTPFPKLEVYFLRIWSDAGNAMLIPPPMYFVFSMPRSSTTLSAKNFFSPEAA